MWKKIRNLFRRKPKPLVYPYMARYFVSSFGFSEIWAVAPGVYSTRHPRADHLYVCEAEHAQEAHDRTVAYFLGLEKLGGKFARLSLNDWQEAL